MYDLLIKNGVLIDGTASPGFHCDIGVSGGKIAKISEEIKESAKKIIDASGLTVTPGFIDSHSHSDNAVFTFPDMKEKIEQGITTSVGGQCGSTIAPARVNDNDENSMLKTYGTMVDAIKDTAFGSNLVSFVGHSALRNAVMGDENRKPTEDEMEKMKELLREAMENGALGISFGLIYNPSCYAKTDELIALAKVAKEYNGIISAHIRDEGFELCKAVNEFLTVIKTVGVKAVFSHHKSMYAENWGKVNHSLKMIEEAVSEGYDIYCDCYPYSASHTGIIPTLIPKEIREEYPGRIREILKDSQMRKKIKDIYCRNHNDSLSNLSITYCNGHPEYEGCRIDEIARLRGQDDFDAAFDIIIESQARTGVCNFSMSEEDVETVLKYERTMICTDSTVAKDNKTYHPRLRGTFPRFLGRYVRERKLITLQEAIRKCTSMPASVYGLQNKGLLREGFDADICIFDADKIIDKADFMNCHERCDGMNYVILSGEVVVENAIYNGNKKGVFIKRRR